MFPVLVVLMWVVFASACGDDASEPTPVPSAEQPRTAAPEQSPPEITPLKIAFLADFSGPLAEFGPVMRTGVALAIRHVSDAGGVNGRDVILVTGDTQVTPTVGVEESRRLVEVAGVHAIGGPLSSSVAIAVAESVSGPGRYPHDLAIGDLTVRDARQRLRFSLPQHDLGTRHKHPFSRRW